MLACLISNININKLASNINICYVNRYNPYDVLGIGYGSSIAVVKKAAAQKLKAHHPDKGGSNSKVNLNWKMIKALINEIYKLNFCCFHCVST